MMGGNYFDKQYEPADFEKSCKIQSIKENSSKNSQLDKVIKNDILLYYFFFLLAIFLIKKRSMHSSSFFGVMYLLTLVRQKQLAQSQLKYCSNHNFFTIEVIRVMHDIGLSANDFYVNFFLFKPFNFF